MYMADVNWKELTGALSFKEMVLDLMGLLKEAGTKITNLNIGGAARTLFIELPAQAFADLYSLVIEVAKQGFVAHATGGWLDLNAENVGLERKQAQIAQGMVTFKRNANVKGNIKIPKGVIVKTPTGPDGTELRFFVTQETIMQDIDSECLVPVTAEHPGSVYSVGAGYITQLVSSVNGISEITNGESWLTQEGADTESDADLRARCVLRWHELSQGSTKYAYQSWALSVEGVREAYILDQHPRGQGTVDIVIVGTGGTPSETLINEVQSVITDKRPVCSDALVRAPVSIPINIDVEVFIHPSEGNEETVKADCEAALDALFVKNDRYPTIRPFGIGEDVTMARVIHALMGLDNVYNVVTYAPNDDIAIESDGLAVKTSIKVNVKRLDQL